MADIKISFSEVRAKAAQIRALNQNMSQAISGVKSVLNTIEAEWSSDAADAMAAHMAAMGPKFNSHYEVVESYAKFLDNTVAQYEALERELRSAADSQFL